MYQAYTSGCDAAWRPQGLWLVSWIKYKSSLRPRHVATVTYKWQPGLDKPHKCSIWVQYKEKITQQCDDIVFYSNQSTKEQLMHSSMSLDCWFHAQYKETAHSRWIWMTARWINASWFKHFRIYWIAPLLRLITFNGFINRWFTSHVDK